jgi:nitroimidazol reductase NimA-like FMN-containing flavoprotein (pyridoxamine 5'-phosphate oxidase superfamily)
MLAEPIQAMVDGAGLEVLDRTGCFRVLAAGGIGRIAVNAAALPLILPVRFALDDERVVFCVGQGSTLDQATRDAVVGFEADGPDLDADWSVSLVGVARHLVADGEIQRAEALRLPRWWLDRPPRFVSLSTEHLTGRRCPR